MYKAEYLLNKFRDAGRVSKMNDPPQIMRTGGRIFFSFSHSFQFHGIV